MSLNENIRIIYCKKIIKYLKEYKRWYKRLYNLTEFSLKELDQYIGNLVKKYFPKNYKKKKK